MGLNIDVALEHVTYYGFNSLWAVDLETSIAPVFELDLDLDLDC
jgi:hypothetical protein